MNAVRVAVVAVALAGCATTSQPTGKASPAPPSTAICLPCVTPCTPDSSCGKAAPAPRVAVTKEKLELKEMVYFDTGEATIKPVSFSLLDEVAAALKRHDELKRAEVEGHTDNVGDAAFNKDLSQRRAEAVRAYLVGKGVEAARLDAMGYGAEKPIAPNDTEQGREANRRVEFRIVR